MGVCTSKRTVLRPRIINPLAWLRAQYKISSRPIGKGHFGRVYKGQSPGGETVALKLVYKKHLDSHEREGISKEAKTLVRLRHPGVLRSIDHIETDDIFLLVTEFVPGKTLQEALEEDQKFKDEQVSSIAR